jgi:hypothetical protein
MAAGREIVIKVDTAELAEALIIKRQRVVLEYLANLLSLSTDDAREWLVAKAAAFRGCSETELMVLMAEHERCRDE